MADSTDRIEKRIHLRASRARGWQAISDSREFGAWFQARFPEPFRVGGRQVAQVLYPGYEHLTIELLVEAIEPLERFAFRWHPNATEPARDYSREPMTLVEFLLADDGTGTVLTVRETGFDGIPIDRRAEAIKSNDGGWAELVEAIAAYLRRPA